MALSSTFTTFTTSMSVVGHPTVRVSFSDGLLVGCRFLKDRPYTGICNQRLVCWQKN